MNNMFWEELTSDLFPGAIERAQGVCLVPLSVVERHGHHLPLATDKLIGRELCRRAAVLEPVIVFPDLYLTQILEARHVPGTIALDAELFMHLLDNVCREIARNGMKKIVLFSAHGGNYHFIRFFAQAQLESRRDYVVYVADPSLLAQDKPAMDAQWETTVDGHAGERETSMIMAIRPDLVRQQALKPDGEGMPLGRLQELQDHGAYTGIWWYADHPTHYRGDGIPATAEKGENYLAAKSRALAALIRLVKQDQQTGRLQDEFFSSAGR
jgi:creatinine amidohydrolase